MEVVCDRVAVLNEGKLVRLGTTGSLLESGHESEIIARGISLEALAGATATNGLVSVKVPTEGLRTALEQVWQAGGEVVSVNPVRKSLETLFLELTTADDQRNTGSSA